MSGVTLRVLDGADKGKVFDQIDCPITIGREEGNTIQLNDERVSRFHLKIQQDHEDLVLTDLESTNGCKVNNEEIHLRILRHGDLITIGRSTLIFGTRVQINQRLERLNQAKSESEVGSSISQPKSAEKPALKEDWQEDPNYQLALLDLEPPRLPDRLSPGQAAQLSELVEYLHMQVRRVVADVDIDPRKQQIEMSSQQWQKILDVQSRLAEYLRDIGQPLA